MIRLTNPIRRYEWGSTTAIPDLLGVPADGGPQAELWVGAHPDSPSVLPDGVRLDDAVRADPEGLLGPAVRTAHGDRLPYLLKVLAAAVPLSLQVHPDAAQAAAGYAEEEADGVDPTAPERRYRDPFHKPEMVIALGDFDALCGWRSPAATRLLMAQLRVKHPAWERLDGLLASGEPATGVQRAVTWLLSGEGADEGLVGALARAADRVDLPEAATVADLARLHPGDPGVIVALLLNRVTLHRGEALFLPAGNVHAYLRGTAIEVMANSDTVLRAGLTRKHVDATEVLRTVDWTPCELPLVTPQVQGVWRSYRPGAAEFALSWAVLEESSSWHSGPASGPRMVLGLEGRTEIRTRAGQTVVDPGDGVLVPHIDGPLQVRGDGSAVVVEAPES
ncbi:mannose-6-phosphate isomerase, class I [soil metagenome]